jgi:general secretion pathway protein A
MYKDHFRLNEMPFSIAPDPRFLFMSERHCEAMAHLLYGIQGEGGIVLLTGEVGTGKTTICRSLIDQLPENIDLALILNPRMSAEDLLQTICEEYHIDVTNERPGIKTFIDALNARLLANHALGRHAILIVDEAQNLGSEVLEQLRLLTNLETSSRKLLQIFLIGQPELKSMLAKPELRQVTQRVIASYHLSNLNLSEVNSYITHRLKVSGASPLIFPEKLTKYVYRASGGVPRLINLICDRALLGAYAKGNQQITLPVLRQAIKDVLAANQHRSHAGLLLAGLLTLLFSAAIIFSSRISGLKLGGTHSNFNTTKSSSIAALPLEPGPVSAPISAPFVKTSSTELALSTLKFPGNRELADNNNLALQSLFNLYGINIDIQSGKGACQQTLPKGMRCFSWHGGLSDLLKLDQPVLLQLSSLEGKKFSATLIALDTETATLMIGGTKQRISLHELANCWFGQFIVVWNAPSQYIKRMPLNYHGGFVVWLRHAMEIADGIRSNGSDLFDSELSSRIRSFQITQGIEPDGQVGPLTIIRLNVIGGKGGPRLVSERKG